MLDEAGVVIDDGVIGRLADDRFYFTTTTTGSAAVYRELQRLIAMWGLQALGPLAQSALPVSGGFSLDGRVFGFLLAVALLSGLAFGLVPALQASRGNVQESLIGGGASVTLKLPLAALAIGEGA